MVMSLGPQVHGHLAWLGNELGPLSSLSHSSLKGNHRPLSQRAQLQLIPVQLLQQYFQ